MFGVLTVHNLVFFVAGAVAAVAFPKVASLASTVLTKVKALFSKV